MDMINAFNNNIDIHADTASRVFNVPLDEVIEDAHQISQRRFNAIMNNLSPIVMFASLSNAIYNPKFQEMFGKKLHTFLTHLSIIREFRGKMPDSDINFLEDLSLKCIYKSLMSGAMDIWQVQLLIRELPNILSLKYDDIVGKIKEACKSIIPQLIDIERMYNRWSDINKLDYLIQILRI